MRRAAPLLMLVAWLAAPPAAVAAEDCTAPEPVCAAASRVYRVSSFDPEASALLIAPGRLVTNRHVVADNDAAEVVLPDGRRLAARVVPSAYPGDLVVLAVDGLGGAAPLPRAEATMTGELRVAGADIGRGAVRVYAPGRLLVEKAGTPRARLHHDAESFPGNSGGAVLDAKGNLVGIATSGGEGRNEAIPAAELDALLAASGPDHAAAHARISGAYLACIQALDAVHGRALAETVASRLEGRCPETGNRQLIDLAAQAFGRAGETEIAIDLFERSLALDPHAVNARIGMAVTLHIAQRFEQEIPHLRWLMEVLPEDPLVLRYAIQAGKWGGDPALADEALERLEAAHPSLARPARRFLESGPDRPRGGPPR